MVKEFKKELTKLSGVDFFNPKYRDLFKRYFPDDNNDSDVNDIEKERLKDVIGEENMEEVKVPGVVETPEEGSRETSNDDKEIQEEALPKEEQPETVETLEELTEPDALDEGNESQPEQAVDTAQNNHELLETRIELELMKAGIREDRVEAAKKLFLQDIHTIDDLAKVKDLINQFPEWKKNDKVEAKPFGMPIGNFGDGLTEEEKRLKAMGIDPRA